MKTKNISHFSASESAIHAAVTAAIKDNKTAIKEATRYYHSLSKILRDLQTKKGWAVSAPPLRYPRPR